MCSLTSPMHNNSAPLRLSSPLSVGVAKWRLCTLLPWQSQPIDGGWHFQLRMFEALAQTLISPSGANIVVGLALEFLSWLQDALQQKTIRELWGTGFITHRSSRVHSTPEGHSVRSWGERTGTWGSALIRVWGGTWGSAESLIIG